MTYASEDLVNEHNGILSALLILEQMALREKGGTGTPLPDLKEMINFFRLFADKCHHGKEENMYFPALEEAGIPKDGGPIGQMLIEHEQGRKYIAGMVAATSGEKVDSASFSNNALGYVGHMRQHIEKENGVLFRMGDKVLSPENQKELLERFEKFEEEVMGPGTHDKLHRALHAFSEKYLP